MTSKKLPLTSMPNRGAGCAAASAANPNVSAVKPVRPAKVVLRSRISTYSGYDAVSSLNPSTDVTDPTVSTSAGRGTGSGRSSSASAKLNTAELAPMPIASETTATAGEPLVSREEPGTVPQIAHQVVEPGQPSLIAKRLHGALEVARFQPGRSRGALGRLAAALRLLGRQFDVEPQLLFEVTIRSPRAERSPQAVNPFTERTHRSPRFHPCSPSSVCMIVDVRAQSAFSLAS